MATYEVTAPDGTKWEVSAPDNASQDQVLEYAKSQWASKPAEPRVSNNNIAGALGRTARSALGAAGGLASVFTEPVRLLTDTLYEKATGRQSPSVPLSSLAGQASDAIGLARPETPLQRVVDKATQAGFEAMLGSGAARALSRLPMSSAPAVPKSAADQVSGAPNTAREVLRRLSDDPLMQVTSAAGGGAAGQQAAESGAGVGGQAVSALGGGLLAAGGLGALRSGADIVRNMLPQAGRAQAVDMRINVALQNNGIDPASINPAMRGFLREQVGAAMKMGDLNDDAIARLADYQRLGLTPTRARLTLDPYDVTREQNAMRFAAATGARDARLPTIANENNQRLLSRVDEFNPIDDAFATGQRAGAPIAGVNRSMEAAKNALYRRAEDMAGGDIPLERGALNSVYGKLEAARKLRFVPENVMGTIDDILNDTRTPFNVNQLDSLKTTIATAQRSTQDGNVKQALKIIRDHLDTMPLTPEKRVFGGSQVVTPQTAAMMRQQDAAAGQLKQALDEARQSNYAWRQWQESAPAIRSVVDDENPAVFVERFVRSKTADLRDVGRAAEIINSSPDARNAVRSELVQYLKNRAIGRGNDSATGNFSGRGWMSGLSDIGERKLGLFFDRDEIETLRAIGRTGISEVFQPRGSAVNNSNTSAGIAGLVQGLSKRLSPAAAKLPFGQDAISGPLDNTALWALQRPALNIPRSLLTPQQQQQGLLDPLLIPGLALSGGLFAPPP